ncbi:HPr kinase/phosphatase C-terminal domain-containing protein [uncultured Roseibium sp.]|uniref:HPr kinase/phosphorylase n=1 Tax=uncultured Roseibium sp. TaxID=1936171 RepID=UPI0026313CCD|nr:HPr kinase/phosphatase C-terminal domain-containing protein [uncultured Roseibium sp.]
MTEQSLHGNCVIVGTRGILILGVSGSGKSELTDTLIEAAKAKGNLGALVADDRLFLSANQNRLMARVPEQIEGLMEVRGTGIVHQTTVPAAKVDLIVDLQPLATIERLPEKALAARVLKDIEVPALVCPANNPGVSLRLIRWGLRSLYPNVPDYI